MDERGLHDVGDPNDTDELHTVMVTALMVLLFVFLVFMLYLAHCVVTKWWYVVTHRLYVVIFAVSLNAKPSPLLFPHKALSS
jgi:hypothetical protein